MGYPVNSIQFTRAGFPACEVASTGAVKSNGSRVAKPNAVEVFPLVIWLVISSRFAHFGPVSPLVKWLRRSTGKINWKSSCETYPVEVFPLVNWLQISSRFTHFGPGTSVLYLNIITSQNRHGDPASFDTGATSGNTLLHLRR